MATMRFEPTVPEPRISPENSEKGSIRMIIQTILALGAVVGSLTSIVGTWIAAH